MAQFVTILVDSGFGLDLLAWDGFRDSVASLATSSLARAGWVGLGRRRRNTAPQLGVRLGSVIRRCDNQIARKMSKPKERSHRVVIR